MAEIKEPEQILREVFDLLAQLEKVKVDVVPIPVVRDGKGKLLKDHTVREHFAKLNEEVDEFKNEVLSVATFDEKLSESNCGYEEKVRIVEEGCDIIVKVYGICQMIGADNNFMEAGIHNVNMKNAARGYIVYE